jgi:hypothetical protein
MANTVLDIVNRALRLLGVAATGESADSPEAKDALTALNMMLDQWNNERLMIYAWTNETFDLTAGIGTYSIGDGGTFDTDRPVKIEKAFIRFTPSSLLAYDFNLEIISNEKYQDIFMKAIQVTYPLYLCYNPTYPLGDIKLWPVPNATCKLSISSTKQIVNFTSLANTVSLPPGYESALAYNLAVEIMPEYGNVGAAEAQLIIAKATETKENLMATNLDITPLKTDAALFSPRGFNILSGSYR